MMPTEENVWDAWKGAGRSRREQRMIARNNHEHFFQFNEFMSRIEPVPQSKVNYYRVRERGRTTFEEYHKVHHPSHRDTFAVLRKLSRVVDPIGDYDGVSGNIGSFIQLKTLPAVIHVCIKKHVQERAVYMLCERIKEHASKSNSTVHLKQYRKKKRHFVLLWTSKYILSTSLEDLTFILLKKLGKRKYIHIKIKAKY